MEYKVKEVSDEKLLKNFQGMKKAYLVEPYNIVLPDNTPKILERVKTFEAREDDVYVVTFVKAGTALMQEIVYLLYHNIDVEEAKKNIREENFPYLEVGVWDVPENYPDSFKLLESTPSPRLIKTHLDYALIPPQCIEKKCKMIYVARNIKDVVVSYFHFAQFLNVMEFQGDLQDFIELFLKNLVPYSPYVDHVARYWQQRDDANILFITYEEMRKDLASVVKKVSNFLGKTVTDEEVMKVVDHCSFENMKKNPAVNKQHYEGTNMAKKKFAYFRKGIVGDWKNHFPEEVIESFDKLVEENVKDAELKKIIKCSI